MEHADSVTLMRKLMMMVENVWFHRVVIELKDFSQMHLSKNAQNILEQLKIVDSAHLIHVLSEKNS